MIKISISLVVYRPNLNELRKVFSKLKVAMEKAYVEKNANFVLSLIDNSNDDNKHTAQLKSLLAKSFKTVYIKTHLLTPKKNLGYGVGNNLSIKKANSHYHLVLNPDVFVQKDTFSEAIKYMDQHPDIGLLIPAVFGGDKKRHYMCKKNPTLFDAYLRFFAPKFLKHRFHQRMYKFEMRNLDYRKEIHDVPFPTGCFMFFRTSTLKKIHGFDEKFFLYYEDADIGKRLLQISHSAYVPSVKIIHQWARRSHHDFNLKLIHIKSALRYFWKWGGII